MDWISDDASPKRDSDTNLADTRVNASITEFVRAVLLGLLTGILALVFVVFVCVTIAIWRRRRLYNQYNGSGAVVVPSVGVLNDEEMNVISKSNLDTHRHIPNFTVLMPGENFPTHNLELTESPLENSWRGRRSFLPSRKRDSQVPRETNEFGRRETLSNTIKRLLRPRSQRSSLRRSSLVNTEAQLEESVNEENKVDGVQKRKSPLSVTSFVITFSCECGTRRAVEVEGVPVGEELSNTISREILDSSKTRSKSMVWPAVKISGKVRRGSSMGKLPNDDANSQIVIVQPADSSSSSSVKRWVVDTISKLSGSLHLQRSPPPS
ncbi:hypothetical protein R1sor_023522 [Riccia sorocarpa]|uniref:Uncharacterized protein n=1 Tax=Riccia sorocarpa TaxID=122646 RepID=A0ABD3GPP8_9MARC